MLWLVVAMQGGAAYFAGTWTTCWQLTYLPALLHTSRPMQGWSPPTLRHPRQYTSIQARNTQGRLLLTAGITIEAARRRCFSPQCDWLLGGS